MSDPISDISASTTPVDSPCAELEGQILSLIGDSQPIEPDERRLRERFPICCKMLLTPIDHQQTLLPDESAVIFGKDLSVRGICFSHDFPLAYRRITVSLSLPEAGQFHVEAEVAWSRRTPIGLYETGCRLIRKVAGHNLSLR
jgi:hypothetical protein